MKVVITGATSFIGRAFVKSAVAQGWECVCVVRKRTLKMGAELPSCASVRLLELDMKDYGALGDLTGSCDYLVHLAWNGTRGQDRMNPAIQSYNYEASMAALASMVRAGCRGVMLAGSQAEYGIQEAVISEESPCRPNTEYGKWKLALFRDCTSYCLRHGVVLLEPRFFSLYGPGDFPETMLISMAHNMLLNKQCRLTECRQMWDFLYIQDAIDAMILLLENDTASGIYNFASGDCRPLKEFVEELHELLGSKSELLYGAIPYPETGMVSIQPHIGKLLGALSPWYPAVSFATGMKRVVEDMTNQQFC